MAALSNIRVLDMSRILAGPWAGQTLADLGADVIKIERPQTGDDTRTWGPPFLKDKHGKETSDAAYFLSANRGKRSVVIDITKPLGQELIRSLVKQSDVLLENFKVDGLKKYGLDYDSLKSVNQKLVYCSITGFGQDGPYSHRPGYDFMIQGMAGFMSITGERDDATGGGPQKVGVAVTDLFTGLYSVIAIQAALRERETTGRGQHIDMALFDVLSACLANQASNYFVSGQAPVRYGNAHPNIVPYEVFPTSDGHIIIAVGNNGQFSKLCLTLDKPDWIKDKRFIENSDRVANRESLVDLIRQALSKNTNRFWLKKLEDNGVPCGPINNLDAVFDNPHSDHRKLKTEIQHSAAGSVDMPASPMRFSDSPVEYRHGPPLLGEHTNEVLQEVLNLDKKEIQELLSSGIIA